MNYILNILLILFIKFYSSEYNNKSLLGVWNLISEIEVTSNNSDKKNKKITNYKIGEKVMELKSNNTIIEYHGGDPKELKCKISNKNINIFEENGSSIELIYYLINDTLVVENYDDSIFVEEALHRLVEIHYMIGLEEEAKKYAYLLGYNYQSGEWYKKTYKVFNKNYKSHVNRIKKDKNKKNLIEKIKSKLF